jgi:hypothetical protein
MPDETLWYIIGGAVVLGGFLVWTTRGVIALVKEIRGNNEPLLDPPISEYARRSDVEQVDHKVDMVDRKVQHLSKETDARFKEAALASSASRDKMYGSIRTLEQSSAALIQANEDQASHLARLDEKIDKMPERIAALLRQ